jgi:transposase
MHIIMTDKDTRTSRRRRAHSEAFEGERVARSLEPGASVSAIALEGGINANLLFAWRRAQLQSAAAAATLPTPNPHEAGAVLLPVEVVAPRPENPFCGHVLVYGKLA